MPMPAMKRESPEPVDPAVRVTECQGSEEPTEEIDPERDHEKVPAAPLVRQATEEEGSRHFAQEIDGADGKRHLARREVQGLRLADQRVTLLAMMISRPSSTHATPRATTSIVWNRDQPSRSSRAGIRLRMGSVSAWAVPLGVACSRTMCQPPVLCDWYSHVRVPLTEISSPNEWVPAELHRVDGVACLS